MRTILNFTASRVPHLNTLHFLIALAFVITLSGQMNAQVVCPYEGGLTLCQQFGNDQAQISINTPTSTSDLMINSWNVNTVFIDATFTVNSPFNVDNSTIKFGPNGRIVVVAGGDFRSTESRYFSCTPVGWAGIHVDGGITLLTTNYIEDAHKAITIANSAAFLSIIENNFNRNVIDIFIPWPVKANAIIAGNLFEATSPLYNGGQSQIGIYADTRTVVFVGLPQTTDVKAKNTFKNHVKGAEGMSATMNFRCAEFLCNSNFGILAKGGRIDIRGSGNYRNLFQKNLADIRVSGSNFYTFGSDFRECLTNNVTSIENLNGQTVEIGSTALNLENTFEIDNNNAFSDFKTGIILDRPTGGGECKIWDNSMTISPWTPNKGRTAIRIIGQPGTMTPTSLFRNVITMFEGGSNPGWTNVINCPMIDIELNRAGNFVLFQNTIFTQNLDLIDHRNRWGFYLHDYEFPAPKSGVHDNDVIGSQPGFDHGMCAYHFIKTGPLEICDNWADYTLRGFHITDNCATSNFAVNHFGHHSRSNAPNDPSAAITGALQMENGSKIGPQFCKHNIWHVASYAPDRAAWHKGNMGNVSESRFDINPFLPGEVSSPIHPASGWFFPLCDEEPGGGHCDMLLTNTTLDEFEQKTAQENQSYTPPATVLQWEERKQLMAKLIRYPGLKALYPLANTFYDVHLNTSAGQFAQFDEMLHDARTIAANDTLALQNIRNQITYWVSRVDSLDGTLQNLAVAQTAGLPFFNYRAILLDQIGQWMVQEENLLLQIVADRNTDLQQCSVFLATLPQTTTYELNQKFLNGLAIKMGQNISFSQSDSTMLRTIAAQCPEIAGYTRERAMNRLPVGDAAIYRPDVPYVPGCQGLYGGGGDRDVDLLEVASGVGIAPNPAAERLTIRFETPFAGIVQILDMAGRHTDSKMNLTGQTEHSFSVEKLSPGVYFLLILSDAGERKTLKFVVSK